MKRCIVVLMLAAMLASGMVPAGAESNPLLQVTVDYEGAWVNFERECFRLYLPAGWMLVESEEAAFVAVNADLTEAMWIDVYEAGGATIDGLLADFQIVDSFENVHAVYFNGVAFVTYQSPASDLFGAVTFSADGRHVYFFKFTPYGDGALEVLATQILSTLSPVVE